jgi:hypothetical protein
MNAKEITALLREVSGQISQDWGYLADKLEDVGGEPRLPPRQRRSVGCGAA